jgi:hypothetical protein
VCVCVSVMKKKGQKGFHAEHNWPPGNNTAVTQYCYRMKYSCNSTLLQNEIQLYVSQALLSETNVTQCISCTCTCKKRFTLYSTIY